MTEKNSTTDLRNEVIEQLEQLDKDRLMQAFIYIQGLNTGALVGQQNASA